MTPEALLIELFERVAAAPGRQALFSAEELDQWRGEGVVALEAQRLINQARPATSAACPGCEDQCTMPLHAIPDTCGEPALFIVCDKRSDINRVEIPPARVTQWQADADSVARFIADSLSLRWSGKRQGAGNLLDIGMVTGLERTQMLCLRTEGELALVAGSSAIPLAEVIEYSPGRYLRYPQIIAL
ncbi:MAG: hypothetical protein U9Q81_09610 [Pseudomonadota bacterium]|nr:hypothetical protein [Pseudomonadota bacterium]